jgi:maltooligosyltrehalose trehalohydrolase
VDHVLQQRRLPVGADVLPDGGVHFRVWAPARRAVSVVIEAGAGREPVPLTAEGNGYFSGRAPGGSRGAGAGTLYRYRLDDRPNLYPDPVSRFQPDGPHGPSEVIDPRSFAWTDHGWTGRGLEGQVIYELHIGTFTPEGTFAAAAEKLPALADVGITVVEVMPVADFPGRFGWGYDGVALFAPTRLYGRPDDFRRFVDRAHALGLGVILDVVYNHFGPDGNYLKEFAPAYVTDRYKNEWGEAINFDGPDAGPVREFFVANAGYWIDEFHLDGLRLDATQSIIDNSPEHVLAPLARRVRAAAGGRSVILVAENEPQHVKLVRPQEQGGYGLDMLWNDDYHHSARVVLSGHNEAYYSGYRGTAQEFVAAARWGYLYQGQRYGWQGKRRGTPTFGLEPERFVNFMENHDQVSNSAKGERCHLLSSPGTYRAMTALTLLLPGTPMLFQGQEFAASSPFLYFADHKPDLAKLVSTGRAKFLAQFPTIALPQMQAALADPADPRTFERCKLDWSERERHAAVLALHRDLLRLRREDPGLRTRGPGTFDGAVLGPDAFALRFLTGGADDRLLLVNFGRDLRLPSAPEPLLAPPEGLAWEILWSSEDPHYGGYGTVHPDDEQGWRITGQAAVLLRPARAGVR